MNFITQLLPGLRDIRGPLIAGYLWLFTGWLLLANHLPHRHATEVYSRAFEVGDVLGRVGLAVAVSLAAYLFGSLVQAILAAIGDGYSELRRKRFRVFQDATSYPMSPDQLLDEPPLFGPTDISWFAGDERTKLGLEDLVGNRLRECRAQLREAFKGIAERAWRDAEIREWGADAQDSLEVAIEPRANSERDWVAKRYVVKISSSEEGRKIQGDISLPSFSAARDLFGELGTIKTRLMETAEHAGSEVERLYAEAELRFTISLPLGAVAIVLATKSGDCWWLTLLAAVAGLLAHAVVLRKHGGREMVEALRSRPDSSTLDQITPVFARYSDRAEALAGAVVEWNWEAVVPSPAKPDA